jgi:amidase
MTVPAGLMAAFWAYERALGENDLVTLDRLFARGDSTLRGDAAGLLKGHHQISEFRSARGGAPARQIVETEVRVIDERAALIVAVTAPRSGGHGLQTQLWQHVDGAWAISAAHVAGPPTAYDRSVWRVVGSPLVAATGAGSLDGQTVAVKDLFAVAGFPIGAGVPAFLAEQQPRSTHAPALARLLGAGASVAGIAQTDQFAYSLAGDNPHYGTPPNAVVAGALPGGSSSGSAAAVALGGASIGLATDTAGSVRVPASYQRLWGLRTTHSAVSVEGVVPLAPDFDTVGLLTRSSALLLAAASVLVPGADRPAPSRMVGLDALVDVDLAEVAAAFRVHQAFQAWQVHGAWISAHPSAIVGAAAERFSAASRVTTAEDKAARARLDESRSRLDDLLDDATLVLPSAASAAPRSWADPLAIETARAATLRLTCIAGVTGRPAVSVPAITTPDGPVGRCYVGPRGSDLGLIRRAEVDFADELG